LNDTTVLLDSTVTVTEDLAQTIALSASAISIFTNVQSLRKAGIDEHHPVLSNLNSDQHSKEQEDKHVILFADGTEPRDLATPRQLCLLVLLQLLLPPIPQQPLPRALVSLYLQLLLLLVLL
jgi:predicted transcriptional regulator